MSKFSIMLHTFYIALYFKCIDSGLQSKWCLHAFRPFCLYWKKILDIRIDYKTIGGHIFWTLIIHSPKKSWICQSYLFNEILFDGSSYNRYFNFNWNCRFIDRVKSIKIEDFESIQTWLQNHLEKLFNMVCFMRSKEAIKSNLAWCFKTRIIRFLLGCNEESESAFFTWKFEHEQL